MAVSDLVYSTHPLDLQLQNEASLGEMGISDKWIRRLIGSERHTPTTQTRIVSSLERMDGVKGKAALVRVAALARNNSDALFFTRMIELLSIYHTPAGTAEEDHQYRQGAIRTVTKRTRGGDSSLRLLQVDAPGTGLHPPSGQ